MHIRDLCRLRPILDYKAACTIATSIINSKLDYCNSLYYNINSSGPSIKYVTLPDKTFQTKDLRTKASGQKHSRTIEREFVQGAFVQIFCTRPTKIGGVRDV